MLSFCLFLTAQIVSFMLFTFLRKRLAKHMTASNMIKLLKAAFRLALRILGVRA